MRNCTGVLCSAPLLVTSWTTYVPAVEAVNVAWAAVAFVMDAPAGPETSDQAYALE
jgi:hypothetical protein